MQVYLVELGWGVWVAPAGADLSGCARDMDIPADHLAHLAQALSLWPRGMAVALHDLWEDAATATRIDVRFYAHTDTPALAWQHFTMRESSLGDGSQKVPRILIASTAPVS